MEDISDSEEPASKGEQEVRPSESRNVRDMTRSFLQKATASTEYNSQGIRSAVCNLFIKIALKAHLLRCIVE